MGLQENLASIQQRIAAACGRAGREPSEITLIAVSKTVPADRIREAIQCGVRVFGENRVQEAGAKIAQLGMEPGAVEIQWHLIGHLQSNKVRRAIELFGAIHSIDSLKLAQRVSSVASELGKRMPVFIEVNLGDEPLKAGATPGEVPGLIEQVGKLDSLELKGLMAVPPFLDDAEAVRPFFHRLRELRDQALRLGVAGENFRELSMGMSNDFEVAIEEGATSVRVGTALFGARQ
ncbi:MAG: YggS family pyridoxal phosphate-dependent enzyme [Blastocatellia bacterium]